MYEKGGIPNDENNCMLHQVNIKLQSKYVDGLQWVWNVSKVDNKVCEMSLLA